MNEIIFNNERHGQDGISSQHVQQWPGEGWEDHGRH